MFRTGEGAVVAVDAGLEFFDEKAGVAFVGAVVETGRDGAPVFAVARWAAVDGDDNDGADLSFGDEAIGGFIEFPITPTEGGVRASGGKGVLAILNIEDGKACGACVVVAGGKVDTDEAVGLEDGGLNHSFEDDAPCDTNKTKHEYDEAEYYSHSCAETLGQRLILKRA